MEILGVGVGGADGEEGAGCAKGAFTGTARGKE